jgi:hypothetical protein
VDNNRVIYRDFDEFLHEPEAIKFTYNGREWTVAASIPMITLFEIQNKAKTVGEDSTDEIREICELVFGDAWEEFSTTVHGPNALVIMEWIVQKVLGRLEEDLDEEGKAPTVPGLQEKLKSARANTSSTGTPSKQTSGGITLSPITISGN